MTQNFALDTKVMGMNLPKYMATLLEKNEKQEIEIERAKVSISTLKQMNNYSRLSLDAAKYKLKKREFDLKNPLEN